LTSSEECAQVFIVFNSLDDTSDLVKVGRDEAHQVHRPLVGHDMDLGRLHGFAAIRTRHGGTSMGLSHPSDAQTPDGDTLNALSPSPLKVCAEHPIHRIGHPHPS
jgi:hypothetical protein